MKIQVHSKPPRFRRAGIEFTREKRVLDTHDLTTEQLAAIEAETMLVVERVESAAKSPSTLATGTFVDAETINAMQAETEAVIAQSGKKKPKG